MLLQITILALSNVLHLHPPTELTLQIFAYIHDVFVQGQHSLQVLRVALRCVYSTIHFTKVHSNAITEARIVQVLQMIVDRDGLSEKLKLLALQALREFAVSGYHMMLMDLSLINTLLKFL